MNQRKKNISRWALPMLLLLLTVGCLVASTGGALARYRAEWKETIYFEVRPPEQVVLGKMVTDENGTVSFDATAQGAWETVEGKQQLEFTVANGTTEEAYSQENQRIHLRLIGTLGIWDGDEEFTVTLQLPPEEDAEESEEPKKVQATVIRIQEGSPMYTTFGDGWVFAFYDEEGEELSWLLEGGELDTVTMTLILEGAAQNEASLLQLQISGVYSEN